MASNFQRMQWIVTHFEYLDKIESDYILNQLYMLNAIKQKEKIPANNPNAADGKEACPRGGKHEWGTDGVHSNQFCKKCFISRC